MSTCTALEKLHQTVLGNIQQSACKTRNQAMSVAQSAIRCMDMHVLLDALMNYGLAENIRDIMAYQLTDAFFAKSQDPEIDLLVNDVIIEDSLQYQTPQKLETKPIQPSTPKKITVANTNPMLNPMLNPIVSPTQLTWGDLTDIEDEKVFKTKQQINNLSWAQRCKLSDTPTIDLENAIQNELEMSNMASNQMTALTSKFRTSVPKKPEKKSETNDGFTKIKCKSKPIKSLSINKHPDKEKTTTSAKWFFFPNNPIMTEKDDWNLWDYTIDQSGSAIPIGWHCCGENKFRINHRSSFIHTKHSDGTWTHEEEVVFDDGKIQLISVSIAYLRWILTPAALRRGMCPSE